MRDPAGKRHVLANQDQLAEAQIARKRKRRRRNTAAGRNIRKRVLHVLIQNLIPALFKKAIIVHPLRTVFQYPRTGNAVAAPCQIRHIQIFKETVRGFRVNRTHHVRSYARPQHRAERGVNHHDKCLSLCFFQF